MPRRSHVPSALIWVSLILIASGVEAAPGQGQRLVSTKTDGQTIVISGALVREDKSAIEGARVMIAEAKDAGFALSIGQAGTSENPGAITDAKGRFSITVPRSLFKDRQEFVVVVPLFAGTKRPMRLGAVRGRSRSTRQQENTNSARSGARIQSFGKRPANRHHGRPEGLH
jgi:hypothetical protein